MKPNKHTALMMALATVGVVTVSAAHAQTTQTTPQVSPTSTTQKPPAKVEKIEVTGSNIRRVDAETSAPIQIISAEDIRRSGAVSVQELLSNLSVSSGGALTDTNAGNGFSSGTASAALRGLGSAATLTLLNGRRISPAAFNDPNVGATVITNLNVIPASAIERIEILKDGASAVYGSDAIAGVINIILRKDFTGALVSGSFAQSRGNEFRVKTANVSFGFGDLAKDRYNVFGTYERYERDPVLILAEDNVDSLWQNTTYYQRGTVLSTLSSPGNYYREATAGSNAFGTFVAARAGCAIVIGGACRYNQWADLEQWGRGKRDTALARGTLDFGANLSAYLEGSITRATNTYTGAPPSSNPQSATIWRAPDGSLRRFQLVLPVGHPDNPYTTRIGLRYRWVDLGRAVTVSETEDARVLAGLKGSAFSWDWESAFLYNTSDSEVTAGRRFVYPAIQNAVNDGSYRFGGNNSQAVIDRISTNTVNYGKGSAQIIDFKASRELGTLRGGPIGVAFGVETRRDRIDITPDAQIAAGNIVGLGASFGNGTRTTSSLYGEAVLPITSTLEATVAARYDKYSDFGNTTNPKLGIRWKVLPTFLTRASYSTGFRAPTLSQTSRSSIRSFQAVNDPVRCPVTNDDADCGRISSVSASIIYNPNLQPETSSARTIGFVWDIAKSTSLTVDYFDIRRDDEIDRFSSNFIVNAQFNGDRRFDNAVTRDSNPATWIPGVANSGPVQAVDRQWLNLGGSQVTGLDVELSHRESLGEYGRLVIRGNGTRNFRSAFAREKGDPKINYVGAYNSASTGLGTPRTRGNLGATWEYGDFTMGAVFNYTGGWTLGNQALTCAQVIGTALARDLPQACRVKAWRTIDLNFAYTGVKNLSLSLVVRNIQDEKPPFDAAADVALGYNTSYHNPLGIYPTFSATYRF